MTFGEETAAHMALLRQPARPDVAAAIERLLREGRPPRIPLRFCAVDYEPTLDEVVEVTFTVNPRFRRIAAHDPDSLPIWEHVRQLFSGIRTNPRLKIRCGSD